MAQTVRRFFPERGLPFVPVEILRTVLFATGHTENNSELLNNKLKTRLFEPLNYLGFNMFENLHGGVKPFPVAYKFFKTDKRNIAILLRCSLCFMIKVFIVG